VAAAIVFWIADVLPEFVTALLVCVAAVVCGVTSARVAFSGFTSASVFLLLVIFGLSSLVSRSGLTFRAALLGMKLFPASYHGQAWALACSGLATTTLIPSINGRLTMAGPLVIAIKDTLRLPDHGRGAAGLALAAYMGFGQMSFLFMNGTAACFVLVGLMPPAAAARVTWGSWLLAALPLGLTVFAGSVLTVLWRFRPERDGGMEARVLEAQLRVMGRIDHQERLGLVALVALLAIFVLEPLHGIEPAWLGLSLVGVLFVLGADRNMLRGVDYPYLLYFGAFVSLAAITRASGVDRALVTLVQPYGAALAASPYVLLGALCGASYLMTAFVPGLPARPVLMIASLPLAERFGYHPLVFALVLLSTMNPGITPELGTLAPAFRIATEQRAVTFTQLQELAWFRVAWTLLGVALSIPLWRLLGMVP
jgi:di/tricarboxylate transporter